MELKRYGVIILDEAHERTINSDVLLALVKQIVRQRSSLRVIVMSATLELAKFQKYFSDLQEVSPTSVINIEGRTFPIEIYHSLEPQEDYISTTVKAVIQVLLFEDRGDILVFLTGQEEIEEVRMMLTERLDKIDLQKFGIGVSGGE